MAMKQLSYVEYEAVLEGLRARLRALDANSETYDKGTELDAVYQGHAFNAQQRSLTEGLLRQLEAADWIEFSVGGE